MVYGPWQKMPIKITGLSTDFFDNQKLACLALHEIGQTPIAGTDSSSD